MGVSFFTIDCSSGPAYSVLLHRIYLTPLKLSKIYPWASSQCWKCGSNDANFRHMLWSWPKLQSFWDVVIKFITSLTTIIIPQTVSVCLLGLVVPLAHRRATTTLLGLLLFYARKSNYFKMETTRGTHLKFLEVLSECSCSLIQCNLPFPWMLK